MTINYIALGAGGYDFKFSGSIPSNVSLFLCLGEDCWMRSRNIEHRIQVDVDTVLNFPSVREFALTSMGYVALPTSTLGKSDLARLFRVINRLDAWGKTLNSRLFLLKHEGGKCLVTHAAGTVPFQCPVLPYEGDLTFKAIDEANPPLTYTGTGQGRLLSPSIEGKYYFTQASGRYVLEGVLETDPRMRGFDCSTFPLALFQTFVNLTGKFGTAVVDGLGGIRCNMEAKHPPEVRTFLMDPKRGNNIYALWSEGHVMLVKNGVIHEFNNVGGAWGPKGYCATKITEKWRPYPAHDLYWVRQLPLGLTA